MNELFFWERRSVDAAVEMYILHGELDSSAAPSLRADVRRVFEDGETHSVVFDLSSLRFVDSVGLGVFFATHRLTERCGGALALACPKEAVRDSLEMTGLASTLLVAPTRADAIIYLSRAAHGHDDALKQAREDAGNL